MHIRKVSEKTRTLLENTNFEWLELKLELDVGYAFLPVGLWEKIGTKLQSLCILFCDLNDEDMKRIIQFCDNLQSLTIHLKGNTFCSAKALNSLNVVRNTLTYFEIMTAAQGSFQQTGFGYEYKKWNPIFIALIRIYPNMTDVCSGHNNFDGTYFKCAFSREVNGTDGGALASYLAYSVLKSDRSWTKALVALSAVRFDH